MTSTIISRRPVDVFAELTVDTPAGRVAVQGRGPVVAVSADRYGTLRDLVRAARDVPRSTRRLLIPRLQSVLHATGTELSLRVGSREVARLDPRSRGGLLARIVGVPGVRVRVYPVLRTLLAGS